MVRLTDRPDMTLDVYRGRKTTIQQQQIRLSQHLSEKAKLCVWKASGFSHEPWFFSHLQLASTMMIGEIVFQGL